MRQLNRPQRGGLPPHCCCALERSLLRSGLGRPRVPVRDQPILLVCVGLRRIPSRRGFLLADGAEKPRLHVGTAGALGVEVALHPATRYQQMKVGVVLARPAKCALPEVWPIITIKEPISQVTGCVHHGSRRTPDRRCPRLRRHRSPHRLGTDHSFGSSMTHFVRPQYRDQMKASGVSLPLMSVKLAQQGAPKPVHPPVPAMVFSSAR